jgi:hypothetical protein
MGMFAEWLIKASELIMMEWPVVVIKQKLPFSSDQLLITGGVHCVALSGLSSEARVSIMALKNCFNITKMDEVPGILRTNYLQVDVTDEVHEANSHLGCFLTLSHANHDCSPCANYYFSLKEFIGQFWAVHNIMKGKEIMIMYMSLMSPHLQWQASLMEDYRFICNCCTCSLPIPEVALSDKWCQGLLAIYSTLNNFTLHWSMMVDRIHKALAWANEEGLLVISPSILFCACQSLLSQGDFVNAQKWFDKAKEAYVNVEGPKLKNVKEMEIYDVLFAASVRHVA